MVYGQLPQHSIEDSSSLRREFQDRVLYKAVILKHFWRGRPWLYFICHSAIRGTSDHLPIYHRPLGSSHMPVGVRKDHFGKPGYRRIFHFGEICSHATPARPRPVSIPLSAPLSVSTQPLPSVNLKTDLTRLLVIAKRIHLSLVCVWCPVRVLLCNTTSSKTIAAEI